jgi:hypothetical protein
VDEVEGGICEWKLLRVCDLESEPGSVAPGVERFDVNCDDVTDTLAEHARDAAVAAAAVDERLGAAKRESELVEAPQAVTLLAGRHCVFAP